jgi:hypothetical protein
MKKLKKIPKFKTEEAEAKFWLTHSSTDYVDWSKARILKTPLVKRTSVTLPLTLTTSAYNKLRKLANKREVSYTALAKRIFREGLDKELADA